MSAAVKTIPKSKAKTAYGLVSDVIRAMVEEPKRVNMGVWVSHRLPEHGGPACGTIGCFAGWVSLLKDATDIPQRAEDRAIELLGDQINYHTAPDGDYVFGDMGRDIKGNPGTSKYALSVVKRIRRFQKINAAALQG